MEDDDPVKRFLSLDNRQELQTDPDQFLFFHHSQTQSPTKTYVGFIIATIVKTKFYLRSIRTRNLGGLVRDPLNPYDSNAISVLNNNSFKVGHIDSFVAAVLAPLIDFQMILVEAIVPCPETCQIHIFSRVDAFETVKSAIWRGGLLLFSNSNSFLKLSNAMAVREKKNDGKEFKSVDEIFKLVDEKVSKMAVLEPLEPPKDVIKSELFVHQKEGLGWLFHRENSEELPPCWDQEKDGSYVNVLTNYHTNMRPEPLRGGIFADDMGLGKTLTLLSLIAFDKCASAIHSASVDLQNLDEMGEVDGGNKGCTRSRKKCKIGDMRLDGHVKGKCDKSSSDFGSKTTLIVCPSSVFSTWVTQLGEHTRPGKLKVYMYYGDRTNDDEELKKYDIVLTTYSTLATEHRCMKSPIKKIEWWRVILDEAHLIKNVNAQQSLAVIDLIAKRRWVVSGTPIQNGSSDLLSLMALLRFEPQFPLSQRNQKNLSRLPVLMATISLRRTKVKGLIGLPPKTIETCYVELAEKERERYDKMEGDAQSIFRDYVDAGSLLRNYSAVLSILLRLRQICIDLASCPSDLKSLFEDASNYPELLKKIVEVLQDGEDFECAICISPPTNIVITRCAHTFCKACILKTLQRKSCCPMCRRSLAQSDLFSAPPEASYCDDGQVSSSKVCALLKLLVESRDQNPATKSVIFSQFRKMLILLEKPLKDAGFKILRLDGSMNAKRRAQVIKEFGIPGQDGPTILLASLKASGTGINLTAASTVYLLEPWWNPAVEDQAIDRVHRIGQKENVRIVRLIARNSIEERILEVQEDKKQAREYFGVRGFKDRVGIGLHHLRILMSPCVPNFTGKK